VAAPAPSTFDNAPIVAPLPVALGTIYERRRGKLSTFLLWLAVAWLVACTGFAMLHIGFLVGIVARHPGVNETLSTLPNEIGKITVLWLPLWFIPSTALMFFSIATRRR
jgi:hypothetical protein